MIIIIKIILIIITIKEEDNHPDLDQVCSPQYDTQCKTVQDEKCEIRWEPHSHNLLMSNHADDDYDDECSSWMSRYEDKCETKYETKCETQYDSVCNDVQVPQSLNRDGNDNFKTWFFFRTRHAQRLTRQNAKRFSEKHLFISLSYLDDNDDV